MLVATAFSCPICLQPLNLYGQSLKCENSHSFDIAKEGYVNFLTRKLNADTKEMLAARRRFLEHGYYRALADTINRRVSSWLTNIGSSQLKILDVGCGEGYYSGRLQTALADAGKLDFLGLDASKDAIKLAAKRYKDITFSVGDINERLPFADGAVTILLNIFAPRNAVEFGRVLAPDGLLLIVIPEADHLAELRSSFNLLNIEENKEGKLLEKLGETFQLNEVTRLNYELNLSFADLSDLIAMTPNYRHQAAQSWPQAGGNEVFTTHASFSVLSFGKKVV